MVSSGFYWPAVCLLYSTLTHLCDAVADTEDEHVAQVVNESEDKKKSVPDGGMVSLTYTLSIKSLHCVYVS